MKFKPWQKNLLSAFVIMAGGFLLFNVAFLIFAFITNAAMGALGMPENAGPPSALRALAVTVILMIALAVFRSKLNDTIKATFLTMPLMTILVLVGMSFYTKTFLVVLISAAVIGGLIYYLHQKKLPWVYYFATIYVAVLGLYVMLAGVEI